MTDDNSGKINEAYKVMPISNGEFTIVDAEDFDWLSRWKWRAKRGTGGKRYPNRKVRSAYAATQIKGKYVSMHRLIIGAEPGVMVDHINRNTLDNRRVNLRVATHSENQKNSRARGVSGYKGVSFIKRREKPWLAMYYIGHFDTPEEAARAYDQVVRLHGGAFAFQNFPDEQ